MLDDGRDQRGQLALACFIHPNETDQQRILIRALRSLQERQDLRDRHSRELGEPFEER